MIYFQFMIVTEMIYILKLSVKLYILHGKLGNTCNEEFEGIFPIFYLLDNGLGEVGAAFHIVRVVVHNNPNNMKCSTMAKVSSGLLSYSLASMTEFRYCTIRFHSLQILDIHINLNFKSNMMRSSKGNTFCVTGHLCREFTGPRWIPRTKASDAKLWCFLSSAPEWKLSKQSWGWWFETTLHPLWRHCHENSIQYWKPNKY